MKNFSHIFLGWDEPLVETAARRLRKMARGDLPADLSHLCVVLPTAEAGRLLRERVAELCITPGELSGGAVDLRISLPETLLRTEECAGGAEVLAAWLGALKSVDASEASELFRNRALARFRDSDDTLLGWAEEFQKCRMELAGEGLSLSDALAAFDRMCRVSTSEDKEARFVRLGELKALEERYLARLKKLCGFRRDPAVARLSEAETPHLAEGVETIVVIDCGDLKGGPARYLEKCGAEVEFWIAAPEELAKHFDRFGRPDPEYWNRVPVELDLRRQVRCVPTPAQQARKIMELLSASPARPGAVAVPDPEVAAALETHAELAETSGSRLEFFVPREIALDTLPWTRLLLKLLRLDGDDSVPALQAVWSDPLFHDYATLELGVRDLSGALKLLDGLRENRFVTDAKFLEELVSGGPPAAAELRTLLSEAKKWRQDFAEADNGVLGAYAILSRIGEVCKLRHLDRRRSESEVELLRQTLFDLSCAEVPPEVAPALLRRLLASAKVRLREESPDAVDVVGFLEANWRFDKTLLVAGFNEECVSSDSGDGPFLPDAMRASLGMMTRDRVRAADALRFKALAASRELVILYGRNSQNGEGRLPSHLLLQCAGEELPERAELLFGDALVEEPPTAGFDAPPFLTPWKNPPEEMRITGFRSYLECPFTYYLEQILRLEKRDPEAPELDNAGCGTLIHDVLERCVKFQDLPAGELEKAATGIFRKLALERFGRDIPGIVGLQCDLLAESFRYFASVQAAEYAAGWRIVNSELGVKVPWGKLYHAVFGEGSAEPWRDEIVLSGKIDRIDLRETEEFCEARVIDYKTAAKGYPPAKTHFSGSVPEDDDLAQVRRVADSDGKTRYWQDLQLPLYLLLLEHVLAKDLGLPSGTKFSAGYFNLPQELTATAVVPFRELAAPAVLESAARCADAVLRGIYVDHVFLPPRKTRVALFDSGEIDTSLFTDPVRSANGRKI